MFKRIYSGNANLDECVHITVVSNEEDMEGIRRQMPLMIRKLRHQGHLKEGYVINYKSFPKKDN